MVMQAEFCCSDGVIGRSSQCPIYFSFIYGDFKWMRFFMLLTTTLILGNTTQTVAMYLVNNMSSRTDGGLCLLKTHFDQKAFFYFIDRCFECFFKPIDVMFLFPLSGPNTLSKAVAARASMKASGLTIFLWLNKNHHVPMIFKFKSLLGSSINQTQIRRSFRGSRKEISHFSS